MELKISTSKNVAFDWARMNRFSHTAFNVHIRNRRSRSSRHPSIPQSIEINKLELYFSCATEIAFRTLIKLHNYAERRSLYSPGGFHHDELSYQHLCKFVITSRNRLHRRFFLSSPILLIPRQPRSFFGERKEKKFSRKNNLFKFARWRRKSVEFRFSHCTGQSHTDSFLAFTQLGEPEGFALPFTDWSKATSAISAKYPRSSIATRSAQDHGLFAQTIWISFLRFLPNCI